MTTIYKNKDASKYVYINGSNHTVVTVELKKGGCRIATITGEEARMTMLKLKHDMKYNQDENDVFPCSASEFADIHDQAQRQIINSLKSINLIEA
jgi:hypothetical protein